jgi:hypothetical protein
MGMHYKRKIDDGKLLAVCEKCGIVEPRVEWNDGWFDIFEWWHVHPLSFLFLYRNRKEKEKRSYEIEYNGSNDELRRLLKSAGEQWTMYATIQDVTAILRRGLFELSQCL